MNQDQKKAAAGLEAVSSVVQGSVLGVGTGSTVNAFIDALANHGPTIAAAVSSSNETTKRLGHHGIPVVDLNAVGRMDLYVDGADEADAQLNLIKGGGGALTREKIVADAANTFLCIVDDSKLVDVLGTFPLPIEVIPMARDQVARHLESMGGQARLRADFVTDNGCEILDVHGLRIDQPVALETRINQIPGVVTVGLFAQRGADMLVVASDDGVRRIGKST